MKSKKRMFLTLLSFTLIGALACAAFAEGKLLTIWNAGSELLFDTSNVSLMGHATFTYDGEVFKTFDGRYRQDDASSYMQVMLDTPMEDGTTYTGGYTVVANNGVSYAIETQRPQYYVSSSTSSSPSILTNTAMRTSLMRFGGLLLDLMEDRMGENITETQNENGTQYQITLAPGQTPEIAGAAMTMLLQLYAKEYLYMNHFENTTLSSEPVDYVYTADYDKLFATEYEKAYNEPLPEDFYANLYDETGKLTVLGNRYQDVSAKLGDVITKAEQTYAEGVAVVENDGSITHYDTYDQYLIGVGRETIHYEDYYAALSSWYEKQSGTTLTEAEFKAVRSSTNPALHKAYSELDKHMSDYYLTEARANGYSALMVYPDGTYKGYTDARALNKLQELDGMTVTRRILYTLRDMQVENADITIQMDKEGRIAQVEGTLSFLTTDSLGITHDLSITFTGTAYDYGTSEVKPFDPVDYGVVSSQEYFGGNYSVNDIDTPPQPTVTTEPLTTITFFGVEYEITPENENG